MIVYLPAALFMVSLLVAYGSAGRRRQAATVGTVVAAAWSLALLVDPGAGSWSIGPLWAIGPIVATVLLPRGSQRVNSSFEGLTRRVVTIATALLVAIFLASRLPAGENPILLSAVPWFLGALGAAWFVSPIDQPERLQGQVLMVAAAAAVILAAVPAGPVTASVVGALALMPLAGERWRLPGRLRPPVNTLLLSLAAVAAVVALVNPSIRITLVLFDFAVNVSGLVLVGIAVLLVAGAAATPVGSEWAALLGVLAVSAAAPSLRWVALGALIAVATVLVKDGERPAWIAFGVLGMTPVLQALAAPAWSARVQAAALVGGLLLILLAARAAMLRVLVLPATGFLVMLALGSVNPTNIVRFQWIAAAGAVFLVARTLFGRLIAHGGRREIIRDQLLLGLLLLGISARDALALGMLAGTLLLIDLAVVRIDDMPPHRSGWASRLLLLARSNWPPSATFAGATIAVIAALQAALALGLLAALLLAGLQLAPLLDRHALAPSPERPRSVREWIPAALSIACGVAPALLLRMLRP